MEKLRGCSQQMFDLFQGHIKGREAFCKYIYPPSPHLPLSQCPGLQGQMSFAEEDAAWGGGRDGVGVPSAMS